MKAKFKDEIKFIVMKIYVIRSIKISKDNNNKYFYNLIHSFCLFDFIFLMLS